MMMMMMMMMDDDDIIKVFDDITYSVTRITRCVCVRMEEYDVKHDGCDVVVQVMMALQLR